MKGIKSIGVISVCSVLFLGSMISAIPTNQYMTGVNYNSGFNTNGENQTVDLYINQGDISISNPEPLIGENVILGVTVRNKLTHHLPIFIDNNNLFDEAHGVTGGNGTESNPYIIEGYDIDATNYGYGIDIANVNQHFIIRNCVVHHSTYVGAWPLYYGEGIVFYNSQNGVLENNTVYSCWSCGICLVNSHYNVIEYNNASFNKQGIILDHSSYNIITNNIASSNHMYAGGGAVQLEGLTLTQLNWMKANQKQAYENGQLHTIIFSHGPNMPDGNGQIRPDHSHYSDWNWDGSGPFDYDSQFVDWLNGGDSNNIEGIYVDAVFCGHTHQNYIWFHVQTEDLDLPTAYPNPTDAKQLWFDNNAPYYIETTTTCQNWW